MKTVLIVATLDTKGLEVQFLKEQLELLGVNVLIMDAGILGSSAVTPDITREEVAKEAGTTIDYVRRLNSEDEALRVMIKGASKIAVKLYKEGKIHGILGIGGTMGTTLGCGVMQALPFGVPKVMISSQANNPVTSSVIGIRDICMFNSVADVAGLNVLTKNVFKKACAAIVGMMNVDVEVEKRDKKLVAVSTKGSTEVTASKIRERLINAGYEVVTFHCFGYGPAALEEAVKEGLINGGVIELANDWLERIAGGLSYPPDDRYENAGKLGLPLVFVPGSCDLIAVTPEKALSSGRKTVPHNQMVWSIRSTRDELLQLGKEVGKKLTKSGARVIVVIPLRGFSMYDREGGPFYDPDVDRAFIEGISSFRNKLKIVEVDAHIMDDEFADVVVDAFCSISSNL